MSALHSGSGAIEANRGNDPASELYRRSGYEDHARFLMTKWLNRE